VKASSFLLVLVILGHAIVPILDDMSKL